MSKKTNLIEMSSVITKNARWPIDCILERIDEFDEVLVIAKRKGVSSFTRFSSGLRDTFWWLGVLERVKMIIVNEGITEWED